MQQTRQEAIVDATPEQCMEIAIDFENYPDWAEDIKEVEIIRQDANGRGDLVTYRAAALGRSIAYTLEYFYGEDPLRCAWQLKEGELLRLLTGKYEFKSQERDSKKTSIAYELSVDLAIMLPSFLKRRLETRLINTAVDNFRNRVENTRQV